MKSQRFVILGEHGSYIIKDITKNRYVADGIETMFMAEKMKRIFESAWTGEQEEIDQKTMNMLVSSLTEAVSLYGRPGGPWNVPSDPGGWIYRAKEALRRAGIEMNTPSPEHESDWL